MRVFVTGATGFVGSAVIEDLIRSGHQVLGLARSDAAAQTLIAAGAKPHPGDLANLESLRSGVATSDGVIHCGFVHDFANFKACCEIDKNAIETLGAALSGSSRPLLITSGTAMVSPGQLATEDKAAPPAKPEWPRVSEALAESLAANGINASIIRLSPSVHGDGDKGFIPILINLAKEKGVSAYVGEGKNRWTAVHRLDAGSLYRLALEKSSPGARFHGVAEAGIAFKDIAEMIGKKLNLPVVSKSPAEAAAHFTWFANFAALDIPASSKLTQDKLSWTPKQAGLLEDMDLGTYFKASAGLQSP